MTVEQPPVIVIATILNEQGPTGVQTHFRTFQTYLSRSGQPSILVTPFSAPKWLVYPVFGLRKCIDPLSGPVSVWWYRHWHKVFLKMALVRMLVKVPDCIIYAQCPLAAWAALEARRSPGQRVVMAVHFNGSQASEWYEKGKIARNGILACGIRSLEAGTLPLLDGIVYVSNFMKKTLEESLPQLTQLSSAVIPNFCAPVFDSVENMEPVDIINVGTLEARKNQQFLLQVLAYAKNRGKCYSLALIGAGPDRGMLERLAKVLGIERQVKLFGNRPDAIQLMQYARLYAHSALLENLPLTIIEAMACGLPILAPAVGGIPDLFAEGEAGKFWNLHDIAAAGELLIRTLDSTSGLEKMGRAARARFDSSFSASKVAGRLHAFIVGERQPTVAATLSAVDSSAVGW